MSRTLQKLVIMFCVAFTLAAIATPAPAADREVVAYRLMQWETVHFDDAERAGIYTDAIKRLGCEVRTGDHGGHIDVSFRCPEWREISVDSHTKAHQWEDWFKTRGFETRHAH